MTIPLEQYSNIKPGVVLEADVPEGANLDVVHEELYQRAKTLVMRQCLDLGEDMRHIRKDFEGYLQAFFN